MNKLLPSLSCLKSLLILPLLFLSGLALTSPPPGRANHVLVNASDFRQIKPLATIRNGTFDGLILADSAPERSQPTDTESNSAIGLNGVRVYAYSNGRLVGTRIIDRYDVGQQDEWNDDVRLLPLDAPSAETAQVFTTQPLPNAPRAPSRKPSAVEVIAARELISGVLARHGVPATELKAVLETIEISPVNVRTGEPEILLITGGREIAEKTLGFFLIGERNGAHYRLAGGNFHWDGAVCGQTSWKFLGNADLDGDGTDELLYEAWGWESVGYWMLKRQNGRWKPAGADGQRNQGQDC